MDSSIVAVPGDGDKPLIQVEFKRETKRFTPDEISSMVLTKMRETAEAFIGRESITLRWHAPRTSTARSLRRRRTQACLLCRTEKQQHSAPPTTRRRLRLCVALRGDWCRSVHPDP